MSEDILGSATTQEPTKSVLDEVVQLKGNEDFKNPEVLAKSVLASDSHIKNLERQLSELRTDLSNRMATEEALKALNAKAEELTSVSLQREETSPIEDPTTTGVNPDQVEAIVSEALNKRTEAATHQANIAQVNQQLAQVYGDEAVNEVKKRAAELGYATEKLVDIAKENPNAFMALMGQAPQKSTNNLGGSDVNTAQESFHKPQERNYAFYEKTRKENPSLYYKPSFQREMHKDLERLGEDFLN